MGTTKNGIPNLKPKAPQYYMKMLWARRAEYPKTNLSQEMMEKFHHQKERCWYCGRRMRPEWITIDHMNPKALGGTNQLSNLVIACYDCNQLKGDRLMRECYADFYHVRHPSWKGLYWGEVCRELRVRTKQFEVFEDNLKEPLDEPNMSS